MGKEIVELEKTGKLQQWDELKYFATVAQSELAGDELEHYISLACHRLLGEKPDSNREALECFVRFYAHKFSVKVLGEYSHGMYL